MTKVQTWKTYSKWLERFSASTVSSESFDVLQGRPPRPFATRTVASSHGLSTATLGPFVGPVLPNRPCSWWPNSCSSIRFSNVKSEHEQGCFFHHSILMYYLYIYECISRVRRISPKSREIFLHEILNREIPISEILRNPIDAWSHFTVLVTLPRVAFVGIFLHLRHHAPLKVTCISEKKTYIKWTYHRHGIHVISICWYVFAKELSTVPCCLAIIESRWL